MNCDSCLKKAKLNQDNPYIIMTETANICIILLLPRLPIRNVIVICLLLKRVIALEFMCVAIGRFRRIG